ncbi:MAG: hypothetical protein AABY00_01820 [Nanoarchaeota archaeon]
MKIQFERINELLGSAQDINTLFGRVELPSPFQFQLKNPHLPVERENLVDPSTFDLIEQFNEQRISYRIRTETSTRTAYISLTRSELMRVYHNRPV